MNAQEIVFLLSVFLEVIVVHNIMYSQYPTFAMVYCWNLINDIIPTGINSFIAVIVMHWGRNNCLQIM